jgi:hypothetical protein
MSCFISSGYTLDCRTASTGGISTVWILGGSSSAAISGYTSNVDDQVVSASGTGILYQFQLTKQGSSFTEDIAVNTTSSSVVFTPTLVMNLPKLDKDLRNAFYNLVGQNNIVFVVRDNNSRYWTGAWTNGALVVSGGIATGQAYTDLNGLNALTIQGGEPNATQEILVPAGTTLQDIFTGITVEL